MKQRLWLVSEVFYPDVDVATGNIATEIALKFSEQYDVHVICGPAGYERKTTQHNTDFPGLEKVKIHRISSFNFDKNNSFKRLCRVMGISLGMFFIGFKIRKNDKAFVISNPAFILPFFSFLKRLNKFDYTLLMHDVFPENLIPGNYMSSSNIVYRVTKSIFTKSRNRADRIMVLGRDMKMLIGESMTKSQRDKIEIVPNWADLRNIYPTPFNENEIIIKNKLQDKIVISFAGNHGVLQNLISFLEIVKKIDNPDLHFLFAGGGATKEKMKEFAINNKLKNVTFLPAFPRTELVKYQNACTIGMVSLSDSLYGVGVPSKSYNICAAEKPILFIGNRQSEIALFVEENNCGWAFSYAEEPKIVDFLNGLQKENLNVIKNKGILGRQTVEKQYSKASVLSMMAESIK